MSKTLPDNSVGRYGSPLYTAPPMCHTLHRFYFTEDPTVRGSAVYPPARKKRESHTPFGSPGTDAARFRMVLANPRRAGRCTICRASWNHSRHSYGWLPWPDRSFTRAACLHCQRTSAAVDPVVRPAEDQGASADANEEGIQVKVFGFQEPFGRLVVLAMSRISVGPGLFTGLSFHEIYRRAAGRDFEEFSDFLPGPANRRRQGGGGRCYRPLANGNPKAARAATICASWPPGISWAG
jgi:hypothetical protein